MRTFYTRPIGRGASLVAAALLAVVVPSGSAAFGEPPTPAPFADSEPPLPAGAILRIGSERFRHFHSSGQAVYAPDGQTIATASLRYGPAVSRDDGRGGVVDFWEATTGRPLARRPGRKAAFSATGRSVALLDLNAVRIYDWPDLGDQPRVVLTRELNDLLEFALSADGRRVAIVYCVATPTQRNRADTPVRLWRGRRILVWDTHDDRIVWDIQPPAGGRYTPDAPPYHHEGYGRPTGLQFSPDGSLIAVAFMQPDKFLLLAAESGRVVRELSDAGWRFATWFSPAGATLYAAREDLAGQAPAPDHSPWEAWDVATGAMLQGIALPETLRNWSCVAPGPSGARVAIGARSGEAVLGVVDVERGAALWSQPVEGLPQYSGALPLPLLGFSPDGRAVAASLAGRVRVWDADTGAEAPHSEKLTPDLTRLALSPRGDWLAASVSGVRDAPQHIRRYELPGGRELARLAAAFPEAIVALAVSPDGEWLAACDAAGHGRVWRVATGAVAREFKFQNAVQSYLYGFSRPTRRQALAFSPDGRWLAACSAARLHLFDRHQHWAPGPDALLGFDMGALNAGVFLPNGATFMAAKHRQIRVFDLADDTPRIVRDLKVEGVIFASAVAADGRTVALITSPLNFFEADQPTTLHLLDTTRWETGRRVELPDSARINAVEFVSEHVLACGENDGQITLRDARTGAILQRHFAHRHFDLQITTTAGGRWASLGSTVLVWQAPPWPDS